MRGLLTRQKDEARKEGRVGGWGVGMTVYRNTRQTHQGKKTDDNGRVCEEGKG